MSTEGQSISAHGWTLSIGAASVGNPAERSEFHAVYRGETFDAPHRGLLAAVSSGTGLGRSAMEAAQIAAQDFAKGYFDAPPTLGAGLAASQALSRVNSLLFSQSRNDPERLGMAASLSAVTFAASKKAAVIHVGDGRIYCKHEGQLRALTSEHLRPVAGGSPVLSRALGADHDIQADFIETPAGPFDRFIIVSNGFYGHLDSGHLTQILALDLTPVQLAERAAAEAETAGAIQATIIVIDALSAPEPEFDDIAAAYAGLPLRPPPQEGDNFDGFIVGRTLYRSRYTLLKRARDTISNTEVVLKLPLPSMLQDQVFRAGFLREAWIGVKLRSRWSGGYIDLPKERRSSLYLVMPYYHGPTLEERLLTPPPVSFAKGISIALKLCQAAGDLMALQVIHRDLKPENIILLANGDIHLLDLGLAYLPGIDSDQGDNLGGTTRYMAPELFKGASAGPRTEVFSLGVTLYRMFSGGKFPFGQREAYPLARHRPDLPPWLGHILGQAIDADPERRLPDAGAFAKAIEQGLIHGELTPVQPRRPLDSLLLWRILACVFALGFFALLLKGR